MRKQRALSTTTINPAEHNLVGCSEAEKKKEKRKQQKQPIIARNEAHWINKAKCEERVKGPRALAL